MQKSSILNATMPIRPPAVYRNVHKPSPTSATSNIQTTSVGGQRVLQRVGLSFFPDKTSFLSLFAKLWKIYKARAKFSKCSTSPWKREHLFSRPMWPFPRATPSRRLATISSPSPPLHSLHRNSRYLCFLSENIKEDISSAAATTANCASSSSWITGNFLPSL